MSQTNGPSGSDQPQLGDARSASRALQQAVGSAKLDLLLGAPDPVAFVQSIPEEELYLAVLEIGPEDAMEVVALSSPDQFKHFLDLAAWPKSDEGPSSKELLRWMRLAREGGGASDAAQERYLLKLAGLDAELVSLLLRRELRVIDLEEDPDPETREDGHIYRTPEGRYLIEFQVDGTEYAVLKQLLDDLFAQDTFGAARMLEGLRWEVPTELEEIARRWRNGRLRDLGFPELEEALSFYARPAKGKAPAPPQPGERAGTALIAPQQRLLERALLLLEGDELERAEEGIRYAANAALIASAVPLDARGEVRAELQQARDTLQLGLELLSGGDLERAAQVLAETPVRQIFQAAMGEAYRLQTRARAVAAGARLPQAQSATLLEGPLSDLVDALSRKRPLFADPDAPLKRKPRALSSRAEVARAEALLEEAAAVPLLLSALGLPLSELGARAEEAGLGPAALRATDVLRALARSRRHALPFSLREQATDPALPEEVRPTSAELAQELDELLRSGTHALGTPAAERAAARLRQQLLRPVPL